MKTLILLLALAVAAHAGPTQLVLHLHDSQEHSFTYTANVDAATYANGATPSAGELARLLTTAKERMADALGYTEKLYGPDHYKLLGAVRVIGAWVESSGRKEPLGWFLGEPERSE